MSYITRKTNGNILRNYICANIALYRLAKTLIRDWNIADRTRFPSIYDLFSLNCPEYGEQINAFIDIKDTKYYWVFLYPIIKELNSEILSIDDTNLYNETIKTL